MVQPPTFNHFVFSIGNGGRGSRSGRKCTWMRTHVYMYHNFVPIYKVAQLHIHFNRYWM